MIQQALLDDGSISGPRCYPPVFTSKCMLIVWLHGLAGLIQLFEKGSGFNVSYRGQGACPQKIFTIGSLYSCELKNSTGPLCVQQLIYILCLVSLWEMIIWQPSCNLDWDENYLQGSIYTDKYSLKVIRQYAKILFETSSQEIQNDSMETILDFRMK